MFYFTRPKKQELYLWFIINSTIHPIFTIIDKVSIGFGSPFVLIFTDFI
jgi:hypothetical protein